MEFSSRFDWDAAPNRLTALLREKRAQGANILDLTVSNPTVAGFSYPTAEIGDALRDPRNTRYEPDPAGLRDAREAVSRYYSTRGFAVSPDRLVLTASTSEAYAYLFKLLADPGDEILVPRPSYPLFEHLAAMESVHVATYALVYDGSWRIDFASLEDAATPAARALIVVNPNNPTGSYLKRDELERVLAFCSERDVALISDEVFSDYALGEDSRRVTSVIETTDVLTFSLSGLSKVAGLPQMKLAWIAVNGPEALARRAQEGLEWIADTYLSGGTAVQCAAGRLLALAPTIQVEIRSRLGQNYAMLRTLAGAESPFRTLEVEGGWSATLQVPRVRTEEEWALGLLRDCDVLVQPGYFYDFETEAFLVVSLLTPPEILAEGVRRLLAY